MWQYCKSGFRWSLWNNDFYMFKNTKQVWTLQITPFKKPRSVTSVRSTAQCNVVIRSWPHPSHNKMGYCRQVLVCLGFKSGPWDRYDPYPIDQTWQLEAGVYNYSKCRENFCAPWAQKNATDLFRLKIRLIIQMCIIIFLLFIGAFFSLELSTAMNTLGQSWLYL